MCGGDPLRKQKKEAAQEQAQLARTLTGIATERQGLQLPFLRSRLQEGLPFTRQRLDFEGESLARAFAPARSRLLRRLSGFGEALPSGFREQSLSDLEATRARLFDDQAIRALMEDEAARERAALGLDPLGFFGGGAQQARQSVLQAQVQPSQLPGILGGALNTVLSRIKLPGLR